MSFNQNLLRNAAGSPFGSDYLRDYNHAAKTFRSNSYQNAPKLKFLFHTYFQINPEAFNGFYSRGVGAIDSSTNFGVLVKDIKLPSYTFDTAMLNQYNRKRIVQTKIKYDPIDITFHDDGGDQINQLWEAYYTYYYYDALNPNVQFGGSRGNAGTGPNNYNERNIYNPSISGDDSWGYNSETANGNPVKVPFFKNITVFGFNQHKFTAYTLINPLITNFNHDQYNYGEGNGIMQNRMTLTYETVVYNYGALDGRSPENIVTGFGDPATYDRFPSPIAQPGSNGAILGQGGLVDGVGGTIDTPARGNLLESSRLQQSANELKFPNLTNNEQQELSSMLREANNNTPANRNSLFDIPAPGSTPGPQGLAGSPVIGGARAPILPTESPAGLQFPPTGI